MSVTAWTRAATVSLLVAGAVAIGGQRLAGGSGSRPQPALGPGDVTVTIDVEHSRFLPDRLRVVEGTRVRFVVDNADPIHHELIVGPPELHDRHAGGTEAEHPSVPGEVSVGAGVRAVTTYAFDEVGTVEFACHLPGHYEYGMHGTIEVVPAGAGGAAR